MSSPTFHQMPKLDIPKAPGRVELPPLIREGREKYPHAGEEKIQYKSLEASRDAISHSPVEGNNGTWREGERGDGKWNPDNDSVPKKNNPEGKTWGQIKEEHNFDDVEFKDGDLDLEKVSKGTVEIDEITESRSDNFDQADAALAEKRGCNPEDVAQWRKEHKYTWHERADGSTMQKVPSIVHGNISHSGGVAAAKNRNAEAA